MLLPALVEQGYPHLARSLVLAVFLLMVFDDKEQGSITATIPDADARLKALTVLGISVKADQTSIVFDEVTFKTRALSDL